MPDTTKPDTAPKYGADAIMTIAALTERAEKAERACITLGKTVQSMSDAMYAALIEDQQNGSAEAMEWISNGTPDAWDGDPGTDWDGRESAQEWFDRTRAADEFNDGQPARIVSRPGPDITIGTLVLTPSPTSADVICAVPSPEGICGAALAGGPCRAHDDAEGRPEVKS